MKKYSLKKKKQNIVQILHYFVRYGKYFYNRIPFQYIPNAKNSSFISHGIDRKLQTKLWVH